MCPYYGVMKMVLYLLKTTNSSVIIIRKPPIERYPTKSLTKVPRCSKTREVWKIVTAKRSLKRHDNYM